MIDMAATDIGLGVLRRRAVCGAARGEVVVIADAVPRVSRVRGALRRGRVLVAVVLAVAVLVPLVGVASAQTVADVEARDSLIANQENLLNTYRCLFGVDTDVVPGECPNPDQVSPGVAPQSPTQQDIEVRDELIQNQEALLNVYRCRFNVDTQIVPGGCGGEPGPTEAARPGPAGDGEVIALEMSGMTVLRSVGETAELSVTASISDGSRRAVESGLVEWGSSDLAVATVEGGVVTAVGAGNATITAA